MDSLNVGLALAQSHTGVSSLEDKKKKLNKTDINID
jgi:hypothetical protein